MKAICAFIIFMLFLEISSAVRINEVMPDCGTGSVNCEFIELYSESLQDLNGYRLDTVGQKLYLNVSLQGFLIITKNKNAFIDKFGSLNVIEWKGMGLSNDGDKVELIYNNQSVDTFSYSKANKNLSWQLFDTEWKECSPTPIKENVCSSENKAVVKTEVKTETKNEQVNTISDNNSIRTSNNDKGLDNDVAIKIIKIVEEPKTETEEVVNDTVIKLNAKKDINIYKSKNQWIKENAIYGFALLCVIIIAVLLIKRKPITHRASRDIEEI